MGKNVRLFMFRKIYLWFFISSCGPSLASPSSPVLIGGTPASPGEFEEVVRIRSGGAGCTASIIGPRVVLTAGHCIFGDIEDVGKKNKDAEVQIYRRLFKAVCTIAPDYKNQVGDQDMAVCKSDVDMPGPYASVAMEGPKLGDAVTLIGYGCTQPGGSGGNDGVLRYGNAQVTRESYDAYYSFHAMGSSALCFGDSGGPAFKMVDDRSGHHYVYGVNSRGNIRDLSLLTAVYHPKSLKFLRDYEVSEGVRICGLSKKCVAEDNPPEDPDPEDPSPEDPNGCYLYEENVDLKSKIVSIKEYQLAVARVDLDIAKEKLAQCRSSQ